MGKTTILPTGNRKDGFWGACVENHFAPDIAWAAASHFFTKEFGLSAEQTRDVLDHYFGRALAYNLVFVPNPHNEQAIILWLEDRVWKGGWRRSYEKSIEEITGKAFPLKTPKNRDEVLTQLAEKHLSIETLVTRNSDDLDFHDVSVWGLKAILEAAYLAGQQDKK